MSESGPQSAIYHASVYHARVRPKRHALRYRVFYLLLDLDRLGALDQGSRLFAYNRTGLVSFHDRDHGDGSGRPAADWVRAKLAEAGLEAAGHRIFALTLPRLFGYVFNPITVYYGYRRDGSLGAVLYEVNNTFGDRHGYLVGISSAGASQRHRHRHGAPKAMHVSPFNRVEGRYDFKIVEPMERLALTIRQSTAEGPVLTASLSGTRKVFSDRALAASVLRHPLLTFKVIAGIHWEALKLFVKGVPAYAKPTEQQARPISIVVPEA